MIKQLSILELDEKAEIDDVRAAYRELVKIWHPDRFPGDEKLKTKATEKIKEINLAYDELCSNWNNWLIERTKQPKPSFYPPPRQQQEPSDFGRVQDATNREQEDRKRLVTIGICLFTLFVLLCFFVLRISRQYSAERNGAGVLSVEENAILANPDLVPHKRGMKYGHKYEPLIVEKKSVIYSSRGSFWSSVLDFLGLNTQPFSVEYRPVERSSSSKQKVIAKPDGKKTNNNSSKDRAKSVANGH